MPGAIVGRELEVEAAAGLGQPMTLAPALTGCGRAFAQTEPDRALAAFHEGMVIASQHHIRLLEFGLMREAAIFQTLHGDLQAGLDLFDAAIDGFHRAGNQMSLSLAFGSLTVVLDHLDQSEVAATLFGAGSRGGTPAVSDLSESIQHLRKVQGPANFDRCVAAGAAMETGDAVASARQQIRSLQSREGAMTPGP